MRSFDYIDGKIEWTYPVLFFVDGIVSIITLYGYFKVKIGENFQNEIREK